MSTIDNTKPPIWFWAIGGIALLWNLIGVSAYIADVSKTAEQLAALPDAQRALYETTPLWVTSAYALAVFGGTLGCILLLLRRKLALIPLIISMICIILQNFYWVIIKNAVAIVGPSYFAIQGLVIIIGIFLLWYSRFSINKGWLR